MAGSSEVVKKKVVVLLGALGLIAGLAIGAWAEKQPHMRAAVMHLQNAKVQLAQAEHDKGGHRGAALNLVNQAINKVKQGIAFDKR